MSLPSASVGRPSITIPHHARLPRAQPLYLKLSLSTHLQLEAFIRSTNVTRDNHAAGVACAPAGLAACMPTGAAHCSSTPDGAAWLYSASVGYRNIEGMRMYRGQSSTEAADIML